MFVKMFSLENLPQLWVKFHHYKYNYIQNTFMSLQPRSRLCKVTIEGQRSNSTSYIHFSPKHWQGTFMLLTPASFKFLKYFPNNNRMFLRWPPTTMYFSSCQSSVIIRFLRCMLRFSCTDWWWGDHNLRRYVYPSLSMLSQISANLTRITP